MNDTRSSLEILKSQIEGGLIVSCQAPANSPLAKPEIIAVLAQAAELNGALAVRVDSPAHISAVRKAVKIPIIGIYKIIEPDSEVYITPTFESAAAVAAAGANIIAVDATPRRRPGNETLAQLCEKIKSELKMPLMADVATFEEGVYASDVLGCTFIGTTLSGYTKETMHLRDAPDFGLIERLARAIGAPVVAEGRIASPDDVRKAFDCGAFSVVVGNAITGIDYQIKKFAAAARPKYTKSIT